MGKFLALEKKYQLIIIFLIIVFIISAGYNTGAKIKGMAFKEQSANELEISSEKKEDDEKEEIKLIVNIKGAVKKPGVYEFKAGDRINDAIKLAEISDDADIDQLNLAQFLKDEQEIIVPIKGAVNESAGSINESKGDPLININTGTKEQLEKIPGVGPVMAGNIIAYRESIKGYKKIEELLNVTGIGDKTLEKLKPYIKL